MIVALPSFVNWAYGLTCTVKPYNTVKTALNTQEIYSVNINRSSSVPYRFTFPAIGAKGIDYSKNLIPILNNGFNSTIQSKTGINLMARSYTFKSATVTVPANKFIVRNYVKTQIYKFTFDVKKVCLFSQEQVLATNAWFTGPQDAKYMYSAR